MKILKFLKLDKVIDGISGYIETRLELFKIEAREEAAKVLSKGIFFGVLSMIFLFSLLFLSVAACIWIGEKLNNYSLGFLMGGGFYLLLGLILYLLRNKLPIENKINEYLEDK